MKRRAAGSHRQAHSHKETSLRWFTVLFVDVSLMGSALCWRHSYKATNIKWLVVFQILLTIRPSRAPALTSKIHRISLLVSARTEIRTWIFRHVFLFIMVCKFINCKAYVQFSSYLSLNCNHIAFLVRAIWLVDAYCARKPQDTFRLHSCCQSSKHSLSKQNGAV